jgi:hypothetical protein
MFRTLALLATAPLLLSMPASSARAATFGFGCITNNSATDCGIGEAQLAVEVTDAGGGQVRFKFTNSTGGAASSITDVYFDDGALLDLATLENGSGVAFSEDASPPDLPGGEDAVPPFNVTSGFLADSDNPPPTNGVNPGEMLGVVFTLQGGQTFADVLDDLASGALRIGIHVQAFQSGGSESFINDPDPVVPEPSGLVLLAATGLALSAIQRSRRVVRLD